MKEVWRSFALLLVLTFLTGFTWKDSTAMHPVGGVLNRTTKDPASDFALTDQNGKPFHLSQLRGKVVFIFFGYTHCPDACPTTMAKLSQVYKLLQHDADRVVTVFASVDPGRDTTSILKSYLAYFHMNSIGLTGTKEEIDAVVKQYGAKYEIEESDSAAGYHINHSTDLYLPDQKGDLARTFSYSDGTRVIATVLRN